MHLESAEFRCVGRRRSCGVIVGRFALFDAGGKCPIPAIVINRCDGENISQTNGIFDTLRWWFLRRAIAFTRCEKRKKSSTPLDYIIEQLPAPETVVQVNKSSFKMISTEILLKVNVARACFLSNSSLRGSFLSDGDELLFDFLDRFLDFSRVTFSFSSPFASSAIFFSSFAVSSSSKACFTAAKHQCTPSFYCWREISFFQTYTLVLCAVVRISSTLLPFFHSWSKMNQRNDAVFLFVNDDQLRRRVFYTHCFSSHIWWSRMASTFSFLLDPIKYASTAIGGLLQSSAFIGLIDALNVRSERRRRRRRRESRHRWLHCIVLRAFDTCTHTHTVVCSNRGARELRLLKHSTRLKR